ncbi:hypothetical protein D3C87_841340 [compost metagenome]
MYAVAFDAVTEKVVLPPEQIAIGEGFDVIAGAEFTVRLALFEVAGGVHVPDATALYE